MNIELPISYEGAALSYLNWYKLAMKRFPNATLINLETASEELCKYFNVDMPSNLPNKEVNKRCYHAYSGDLVKNDLSIAQNKELGTFYAYIQEIIKKQ